MTRSIFNKGYTRQEYYYFIIIFWLFLASLNFATRYYYWNYIAFAFFLIAPTCRIRVNVSSIFLLVLALSMLIFDQNSCNGITDMIKPFVFLVSYTVGMGLFTDHNHVEARIKETERIIYVCAFGALTHYFLNLLLNINSLERDTIDIWTGSVMSATGQASLASMCVGIVAALLFSDHTRKTKIAAVVLSLVIILYNMILAGRTLIFMLLIVFVIALFYQRHDKKVKIGKELLVLFIFGALLLFIYNLDLFSIKTSFEQSNFYTRFFGKDGFGLFDDPRLDYKRVYLNHIFDYPFGGTYIRRAYGFYAHDLYLDTCDQYSIFAGLAIVAYIVSSIIRLVKCLSVPTIPFRTKQLMLCVYAVMNMQFLVEPIIQGMPTYFVSYCLVDGVITRYLAEQNAELGD